MEESEEAELNAAQQRAVLIMGKLVTLAIGTLVVGFSYCVPYVSDSVVDSANLLSSAFYGPILATFSMGYVRSSSSSCVCVNQMRPENLSLSLTLMT